ETAIVTKRLADIGMSLELPEIAAADQEIARIVMLFRELRGGQTLDGKLKLKTVSGTLSTAEAISVGINSWAEAAHFGDGAIDAQAMAANLVGAIVKDPVADTLALQEYLENVVRKRKGWQDLYGAIRDVM
ncbi:MAG: ATPase, partial [Pseudomonadota bacterium]